LALKGTLSEYNQITNRNLSLRRKSKINQKILCSSTIPNNKDLYEYSTKYHNKRGKGEVYFEIQRL